jgi:hypothetical protein
VDHTPSGGPQYCVQCWINHTALVAHNIVSNVGWITLL